MKFNVDARPVIAFALNLTDRLQVAFSPKKCLGGTPTNGVTKHGYYTLVINSGRETLSNAPTPPTCVAPGLIETVQEGNSGSACRRICGLCNQGVWATNGSPGEAVTDSGWMRADTL